MAPSLKAKLNKFKNATSQTIGLKINHNITEIQIQGLTSVGQF